MTLRLATSVWVGALLRRAAAAGVFAAVLRRGDPVAGAVILISRSRDGHTRAWSRVAHGGGTSWSIALEAYSDEGAKIDEYLARQARYDCDLWAIELIADEIQPLIAETSHSD